MSPLRSSVRSTVILALAVLGACKGETVVKDNPEVVSRLNAAFNEALTDPTVRQKLIDLGFLPVGGAGEAYAAVLTREIAKWKEVIRDSNIPAPN